MRVRSVTCSLEARLISTLSIGALALVTLLAASTPLGANAKGARISKIGPEFKVSGETRFKSEGHLRDDPAVWNLRGEFPKIDTTPVDSRFHDDPVRPRLTKFSTRTNFVEYTYGDYLARPVENPQLLSVFPTNSNAFQKTFGREPTARESRQLRTLHSSHVETPSAHESLAGDLDALSKDISTSNSDLIVIFGHSRAKGSELVLPSGNSVKTIEIHSACRLLGKNCFVLTCDGSDFGVKGSLAAAHAIPMYRAAAKSVKAVHGNSTVTAGEFRRTMINARASRVAQERIALSVLSISPVGVYVVTAEEAPRKQNVAPRSTKTSTG